MTQFAYGYVNFSGSKYHIVCVCMCMCSLKFSDFRTNEKLKM